MKLIAHRGNISGPNLLEENKPDYIEKAIDEGFDVEVDLRHKDHNFYLGHDEPQYHVPMSWLVGNKSNLWIHCKDWESLDKISNSPIDFNYFWHEKDRYTLTSHGYIWSFPGQSYNSRSIIVMPEISDIMIDMKVYDCFGICSDYVGKIK